MSFVPFVRRQPTLDDQHSTWFKVARHCCDGLPQQIFAQHVANGTGETCNGVEARAEIKVSHVCDMQRHDTWQAVTRHCQHFFADIEPFDFIVLLPVFEMTNPVPQATSSSRLPELRLLA